MLPTPSGNYPPLLPDPARSSGIPPENGTEQTSAIVSACLAGFDQPNEGAYVVTLDDTPPRTAPVQTEAPVEFPSNGQVPSPTPKTEPVDETPAAVKMDTGRATEGTVNTSTALVTTPTTLVTASTHRVVLSTTGPLASNSSVHATKNSSVRGPPAPMNNRQPSRRPSYPARARRKRSQTSWRGRPLRPRTESRLPDWRPSERLQQHSQWNSYSPPRTNESWTPQDPYLARRVAPTDSYFSPAQPAPYRPSFPVQPSPYQPLLPVQAPLYQPLLSSPRPPVTQGPQRSTPVESHRPLQRRASFDGTSIRQESPPRPYDFDVYPHDRRPVEQQSVHDNYAEHRPCFDQPERELVHYPPVSYSYTPPGSFVSGAAHQESSYYLPQAPMSSHYGPPENFVSGNGPIGLPQYGNQDGSMQHQTFLQQPVFAYCQPQAPVLSQYNSMGNLVSRTAPPAQNGEDPICDDCAPEKRLEEPKARRPPLFSAPVRPSDCPAPKTLLPCQSAVPGNFVVRPGSLEVNRGGVAQLSDKKFLSANQTRRSSTAYAVRKLPVKKPAGSAPKTASAASSVAPVSYAFKVDLAVAKRAAALQVSDKKPLQGKSVVPGPTRNSAPDALKPLVQKPACPAPKSVLPCRSVALVDSVVKVSAVEAKRAGVLQLSDKKSMQGEAILAGPRPNSATDASMAPLQKPACAAPKAVLPCPSLVSVESAIKVDSVEVKREEVAELNNRKSADGEPVLPGSMPSRTGLVVPDISSASAEAPTCVAQRTLLLNPSDLPADPVLEAAPLEMKREEAAKSRGKEAVLPGSASSSSAGIVASEVAKAPVEHPACSDPKTLLPCPPAPVIDAAAEPTSLEVKGEEAARLNDKKLREEEPLLPSPTPSLLAEAFVVSQPVYPVTAGSSFVVPKDKAVSVAVQVVLNQKPTEKNALEGPNLYDSIPLPPSDNDGEILDKQISHAGQIFQKRIIQPFVNKPAGRSTLPARPASGDSGFFEDPTGVLPDVESLSLKELLTKKRRLEETLKKTDLAPVKLSEPPFVPRSILERRRSVAQVSAVSCGEDGIRSGMKLRVGLIPKNAGEKPQNKEKTKVAAVRDSPKAGDRKSGVRVKLRDVLWDAARPSAEKKSPLEVLAKETSPERSAALKSASLAETKTGDSAGETTGEFGDRFGKWSGKDSPRCRGRSQSPRTSAMSSGPKNKPHRRKVSFQLDLPALTAANVPVSKVFVGGAAASDVTDSPSTPMRRYLPKPSHSANRKSSLSKPEAKNSSPLVPYSRRSSSSSSRSSSSSSEPKSSPPPNPKRYQSRWGPRSPSRGSSPKKAREVASPFSLLDELTDPRIRRTRGLPAAVLVPVQFVPSASFVEAKVRKTAVDEQAGRGFFARLLSGKVLIKTCLQIAKSVIESPVSPAQNGAPTSAQVSVPSGTGVASTSGVGMSLTKSVGSSDVNRDLSKISLPPCEDGVPGLDVGRGSEVLPGALSTAEPMLPTYGNGGSALPVDLDGGSSSLTDQVVHDAPRRQSIPELGELVELRHREIETTAHAEKQKKKAEKDRDADPDSLAVDEAETKRLISEYLKNPDFLAEVRSDFADIQHAFIDCDVSSCLLDADSDMFQINVDSQQFRMSCAMLKPYCKPLLNGVGCLACRKVFLIGNADEIELYLHLAQHVINDDIGQGKHLPGAKCDDFGQRTFDYNKDFFDPFLEELEAASRNRALLIGRSSVNAVLESSGVHENLMVQDASEDEQVDEEPDRAPCCGSPNQEDFEIIGAERLLQPYLIPGVFGAAEMNNVLHAASDPVGGTTGVREVNHGLVWNMSEASGLQSGESAQGNASRTRVCLEDAQSSVEMSSAAEASGDTVVMGQPSQELIQAVGVAAVQGNADSKNHVPAASAPVHSAAPRGSSASSDVSEDDVASRRSRTLMLISHVLLSPTPIKNVRHEKPSIFTQKSLNKPRIRMIERRSEESEVLETSKRKDKAIEPPGKSFISSSMTVVKNPEDPYEYGGSDTSSHDEWERGTSSPAEGVEFMKNKKRRKRLKTGSVVPISGSEAVADGKRRPGRRRKKPKMEQVADEKEVVPKTAVLRKKTTGIARAKKDRERSHNLTGQTIKRTRRGTFATVKKQDEAQSKKSNPCLPKKKKKIVETGDPPKEGESTKEKSGIPEKVENTAKRTVNPWASNKTTNTHFHGRLPPTAQARPVKKKKRVDFAKISADGKYQYSATGPYMYSWERQRSDALRKKSQASSGHVTEELPQWNKLNKIDQLDWEQRAGRRTRLINRRVAERYGLGVVWSDLTPLQREAIKDSADTDMSKDDDSSEEDIINPWENQEVSTDIDEDDCSVVHFYSAMAGETSVPHRRSELPKKKPDAELKANPKSSPRPRPKIAQMAKKKIRHRMSPRSSR